MRSTQHDTLNIQTNPPLLYASKLKVHEFRFSLLSLSTFAIEFSACVLVFVNVVCVGQATDVYAVEGIGR